MEALRAAGRLGVLVSEPGAAGFGGCGWWRALVVAAEAAVPGVMAGDVLDCGDAPGHAMAALRIGQRRLVLEPSVPAFRAVAAAAEALGGEVLAVRPEAVAMAGRDAAYRLGRVLAGR